MSIRFRTPALLAAAALLALIIVNPSGRPGTALAGEPPAEWDGLVRTKHKQLDNFYVLPGANLSGYKRIRLDPAEVSFAKNWKPNEMQRNPSARLNDEDIERIRSGVASEFEKVFREQLTKAGYMLSGEDGEDVLRATPMIVNLYINAPDKMTPGRSTTYVSSPGQLTLVLALSDSVSGQHLVRAVDTHRGRDSGSFQVSSSVFNLATARDAFDKWAQIMISGLKEANTRASTG
jgi:Protein of unknown function (DUF3313)